MDPSHRVEVASTTTCHEPISLCVGRVYGFRRMRHINVVKWYSNMHARITSIHMHVVVVFKWYTPLRGYRRQAYIFVGLHGHP